MTYHAPTSLSDALAVLTAERPRIVAGCTDVFPAQGEAPLSGPVLDITRVAGLRGIAPITQDGAAWRIGAATTWTDILRADLPPAFDGLKLAAREVGSVQIQNRATLAGNICNASPAADGVPPLLALDASVELTSQAGPRVLPLSDFITGPRQVALRSDQLVSALLIPSAEGQGAFLKLGSRTHLVISIAMVAANLCINGGSITSARVAVGSCSAVAQRLGALEVKLVGQPAAGLNALPVTAEDLAPLRPIDDVRGSAGYRLDAAAELIRRALCQAAEAA